jgi:hypothetical protein
LLEEEAFAGGRGVYWRRLLEDEAFIGGGGVNWKTRRLLVLNDTVEGECYHRR